jgi:hypothetical protein
MADKNMELGNKNLFGNPTHVASQSRMDTIIEKTKALAFPSGAILSLENFESYGGGGAGYENSVALMGNDNGKGVQESYRIGLSESANYTEKVADR